MKGVLPTREILLFVQLTILVWAEPKIKRPGANRSPIVHLRISRSTQVAGERECHFEFATLGDLDLIPTNFHLPFQPLNGIKLQ